MDEETRLQYLSDNIPLTVDSNKVYMVNKSMFMGYQLALHGGMERECGFGPDLLRTGL